MKFILGKKLKMTQLFNKEGQVQPVTAIQAGPCFVTAVKELEKNGYQAIQLGFEDVKEKALSKPQKGHLKKALGENKFLRNLKEFRVEKTEGQKIGNEIKVGIFNPGDIVKVVGVSKGKGFQGVVKRHGFKGGPASHGQKHTLRAPGSIGCMFPQRVLKGKRMAGRMGNDQVTLLGLEVARIDEENNLLFIKGAVPGRKGTLLKIMSTFEAEPPKEEVKTEEVVEETKKEVVKEEAVETKKEEDKK